MRISLSRLGHSVIFIIPFFCLFLVCSCGYKYIKAYEGPDLPQGQFAKFYLDKNTANASTNMPVSYIEVDGKPYERGGISPCLLILPGKHEVTIRPESQMVTERTTPIGGVYSQRTYTVVPIPKQHTIKFTAEKGKEYFLAYRVDGIGSLWNLLAFWIEDKISKNRITEEIQFEWK